MRLVLVKFNNFLNSFERFFKRFLLALIVFILIPIALIAFIFGRYPQDDE